MMMNKKLYKALLGLTLTHIILLSSVFSFLSLIQTTPKMLQNVYEVLEK